MFAQLVAVMMPVMVTAGIGYFWVRAGQSFPTEFVARLVLNVGTPCLVLSTLSKAKVDLSVFSKIAVACFVVMLVMAAIGLLLSRLARIDWRVLVPAYLFPNSGNMGLPFALYAFGEEGLALAVVFFLVLSISHFSIGMMLSGSTRPRELLRNPIMISLVLAIPCLYFDVALPRWLDNSLSLLAGMTIPLMLLTLGVSLASIRVAQLGPGLLLGGLRLVCGAAAAWALGTWLGLEGLPLAVLILQSSMPVAVFNYLFAVRAGRSPEQVASLVFCSTVLSFLLLPLLLPWLMRGL